MSVEKEKSVTVSLPDKVTVKISLVRAPEDFLGLYFLNTDLFSDKVTGVLGVYQSGCVQQRETAFHLFFLDI